MDIRLLSYDVMICTADLSGVSVDYLPGRESQRLLDISYLTDEEAAVLCAMVSLLERKKEKPGVP